MKFLFFKELFLVFVLGIGSIWSCLHATKKIPNDEEVGSSQRSASQGTKRLCANSDELAEAPKFSTSKISSSGRRRLFERKPYFFKKKSLTKNPRNKYCRA